MNFDARQQGDADRSRVPVHTISSDPVPDEANTQFATALVQRLTQTIGIKLRELGHDASTLQSVAKRVVDLFPELGIAPKRQLEGDPVALDDKNGASASAKVDLIALTDALESVAIAQPTELCNASANLGALATILNLQPVEKKLLALCFAASYCTQAERFDRVAYALRFNDTAHKHHLLSVLLGEPLDDVRNVFSPPCRLLGLRFVAPKAWHRAAHLSDILAPTIEMLELLQTRHRSWRAVLAYALESEFDCSTVVAVETPLSVYQECYPDDVAQVYQRTVQRLALRGADIRAAIQWFTASEIAIERLEPLAGRLDFETVRETIKQCIVDCSQRDVPTTEFKLLQALYAAAK